MSAPEIKEFSNFNLREIVLPVDVDKLEELLIQAQYDSEEIRYLCKSFREGFDLGYRGPTDRGDLSQNIPFHVWNSTVLWNKVMDEVELGHFAGPYENILEEFQNSFIQSPIRLVLKDSNKTQLIFHLSYRFKNGNESVNFWTPRDQCSVKYNDLDVAVQDCLYLMKKFGISTLYFSKSDLKSAFRILGICFQHRRFLIMKAQHLLTKKWLEDSSLINVFHLEQA